MPAQDDAAMLVARFLRANAFGQTLAAFLREAGLPPDAGALTPDSLTIETVLQEKRMFDLAANFEKLCTEGTFKEWRLPEPSVPLSISLPTSSNILRASLEHVKLTETSNVQQLIVATTADRRLNLISIDGRTLIRSLTNIQDSPILSYELISCRFILCTSMSGRLVAFDLWQNRIIAQRMDHSKYAVKLAVHKMETGCTLVATAGWDKNVFVYNLTGTENCPLLLAQPVGKIELTTNPEDILFTTDPAKRLFLILTRRESTYLYYYTIRMSHLTRALDGRAVELQLDGKQNLAPHSNTWATFTPAALALCPSDPGIVAVATSAVPHMKLLLARLLFPSPDSEARQGTGQGQTLAPQMIPLIGPEGSHLSANARQQAEITQQNREGAAILSHCPTFAPQTAYSTPALAWRPDGSGVFVSGDDGVVRGIDAEKSKVISNLRAHIDGSKIRCLWTGVISNIDSSDDADQEEVLLSGGFDQRLILWRATRHAPPVQ